MASRAARMTESRAALDPPREPTKSQLEIMHLLARGMTHREAGERLGISYQTVKNQLSENGNGHWGLYQRIGARNVTHALWLLIEQGYIDVPGRAERRYARLLENELARVNGNGNGVDCN